MSILDDVRRLASEEPIRHTECIYCSAIRDFPDCVEDHTSDCPWLSMPKIAAVLEAVYGLMMTEDGAEPIERAGEDGDVEVWAFCQRPADGPHWEGCLWVKLAYLVYGVKKG